jgi:catechol 2,3-dioxygenase-like lactoylglutathione lyase family enzyme
MSKGASEVAIPSERRRIMQVCWVVPDIDAAMASWIKTMGIGPFFEFRDLTIDTVKHRGTPTSTTFHIAVAQAGGVQIELAQQVSEGAYAYNEVFPNGSEGGLHHIAIYVADYDAAMKHFTDQGFEPSVEGVFGTMRFAYVDTRSSLGCMVEIIEHNVMQDEIFTRVARGAEDWDGVTDPIRPGLAA